MTCNKELAVTMVLLLSFACSLFSQPATVLKLHPQNPHYFLYQNKAMVIIGSGEHYGSVVNQAFDYKKYLETLYSDGLNTTRLFTGAYVEKSGDFGIQKNTLAPAPGQLLLPWKRSNVAGYSLGGNKFDLNEWDEAYFERLRDFMTEARKNGVIVEVNLFSAHYGEGWNYSAFNTDNNINQTYTSNIPARLVNTLQNGNVLTYQEQYVRKIVHELNDFDNLYFEIQNEPWADQTDTVLRRNDYGSEKDWTSTLQVVSQRSNDWQRQVARWITDEESQFPRKHLISQNISNYHYPISDPDTTISIFNFHYSLPEAVTENYYLNKVVGFNETGFAGGADITYRRQAWRFLMAGGALFNHLDYSFSVGSEDGRDSTYKAPGGGSPGLRAQLAILKRFFERLPIVKLRPDHAVVAAAPGATTQALSAGDRQWIIYVESMAVKPYQIKLNLPKGTYAAEWTDVTTGQVVSMGPINSGSLGMPATSSDKVVVIRAAPVKK